MTAQEATIRRGVRNARYSTIPNHVFEDTRMSMEARWLLCYLLSKPDNWIARIRDIRNVGQCGRDKATAMVNELIEFGYAEREQLRDGGKFGNTVLVVYDEPRASESGGNQAVEAGVASLPQPDLPDTVSPDTVLPEPVNPTPSKDLEIVITDSSNERERASEVFESDVAPLPKTSRRSIERAFKKWFPTWPTYAESITHTAEEAWFALSDDQRAACIDRTSEYVEWCGGKKKITMWAAVYLRERCWEKLPPKAHAEAKPELVRPFGKSGMAARFAEAVKAMRPESTWPAPPPFVRDRIARGGEAAEHEIMQRRERYGWPKLYDINEKAAAREGYVVSPDVVLLGADFVSIDMKGPVAAAWRRLHDRMRLPWLRVEPDYAYFPPIVEGAEDLDTAVLDAFWSIKQRIEGNVRAAAE